MPEPVLFCLLGIVIAFITGGVAAFAALRAWPRARRDPDADDLQAIVARNSDALLRFDPDLRCTYASPSAVKLLGWPLRSLIGAGLDSLFPTEAKAAICAAAERAREGWDGAEAHIRSFSQTGDQVWIEARLSTAQQGDGLVASLRDISTRKTAELALRVANTELSRLAGSDTLTGLPNRRRFEQMLEGACRRASRQSTPVSMLLIDVEAPHASENPGLRADLCLQQVAGAISGALGSSFDAAARFAGEEFAVMLPGRDTAAAQVEADRIREAVVAVGLLQEMPRAGHSRIAASVGCATVRPSPDRPPAAIATSLIAQANRALDRARPIGRSPVPAALVKPATTTGLHGAAA